MDSTLEWAFPHLGSADKPEEGSIVMDDAAKKRLVLRCSNFNCDASYYFAIAERISPNL